jgi:hypothetical protein
MGAIEWKDEQVNDHSSGVTDLITASQPDFQHYCNNLEHNAKLQILSTRDGYARFTTQQTATKIQQLFKLENWLIAYCYDDPATTTEQIAGRIFYRLESDTTSAWTEVIVPKDRSSSVSFRIYDSTGKGFILTKSSPTFDNFVVKEGTSTTAPVISYDSATRTVFVTVDPTKVDATTKKYATGSGNLDWSWFTTAFTTGWACTLLASTTGTDDVKFDEKLTVQAIVAPVLSLYPANARSDGNGTALSYVLEQGHLQASEWQSHLYMALEPYIKTFTANASDLYGKDPDTYPPDNNRLPLRKIAPIATGIGDSPSGYALKALNAQLPKAFIGVNTEKSVVDTYTANFANARYQCWELKWDYASSTYLGDETATIEIWSERTWGQVGDVGDMTTESYLRYESLNAKNPVDNSLPFGIADYAIQAVSPYTGVNAGLGIDWGKLYLVHHHQDAASVVRETRTYTETVEAVQAAFEEYNKRFATISATTYYASHQKFGFYIKVNPKAKVNEQLDLTDCFLSVRYCDNLPEDVAGNYQYGYAFYLRDTYEGSFEGAPREFIFDGPVAFEQVRTLSKIGLEPLVAYTEETKSQEVNFSTSPIVYGGIAARMDRTTDLYYQSSLEAIFARTLAGGDAYYVDQASRFWYRTGDLSVPSIPQQLVDAGWVSETAYVVPHQSNSTDENVQFEEAAYFNGGVLGFDSIPQGPYYFSVVNQIGYAAQIVNNIQRVYQSIPGIPHASPATLFDDFDDEITGISSFSDKPIVTTQNKIWRIEGVKSSDGSGSTFLRTVSDEFGCISNQSIVQTNIGLFLWSNSGIIYTDGLRAFRVTEHLLSRYQSWLSAVRSSLPTIGVQQLRGTFDELNRVIYWSLKDTAGKPFFVVLSLQKGVSPMMPVRTVDGIRSASVNTSTGVITYTDRFLTHATLYSEDYLRFYRAQGKFLMYSKANQTYDTSDTDSLTHPIEPYYRSIAFAYGIPWARKQTSQVRWILRDILKTGVSFQPLGWNDLDDNAERLTGCLNFQHLVWDINYANNGVLTLQQFWKHSDCSWKGEKIVSYRRRFRLGGQRNCFKQVGFEALKLKYAEISRDTATITSVNVVYKGGWPQATALIQVVVTSSVSNAIIDLLLDRSGQFYVAWEPNQVPVAINQTSLATLTYTIPVLLDSDNNTGSDYTLANPTLRFYRKFTDQRIDLLGYNVTFRIIGDRTHGAIKATDHGGGVNG